MPFQPESPPWLQGTISTIVEDMAGVAPATIIKLGDAWRIKVDWEMHGFGVPGTDGDWHVSAYVEKFGPGFEGQVGATKDVPVTSVPLNAGPPQNRQYSLYIDVPGAGPTSVPTPGVYRLVTLVTHTLAGMGPPDSLNAFTEGPFLQFYT